MMKLAQIMKVVTVMQYNLKTGEQFKYDRKLDERELAKFIIVDSLYSKIL